MVRAGFGTAQSGPACLCDACREAVERPYRERSHDFERTLAAVLCRSERLWLEASTEYVDPDAILVRALFPKLDPRLVFPAEGKAARDQRSLLKVLRRIGRPVAYLDSDAVDPTEAFTIFDIDERGEVEICPCSDAGDVVEVDAVNALDFGPDGEPLGI
jgi:hypothetical protein